MVGSGGPRRDTSTSVDHAGGGRSGGAVVLSDSSSSVGGGLGGLDEGSGMGLSEKGSQGDVRVEIAAAGGGCASLDTIGVGGGLVGSGTDRRRDGDSGGNASRGARGTITVSVSVRLGIEKSKTYLELEAVTAPALP